MSRRLVLLRAAAFACAATIAQACRSATDSGPPPVNLLGTWNYAAAQTAPTTAQLTGTLTITRQRGHDLNGTLQVVQTTGGGAPQSLSGVVSGRAVDSTTVDFDAFLSATGRRHLGTVGGDSIVGEWLELSDGPSTTGTFRARRVSP